MISVSNFIPNTFDDNKCEFLQQSPLQGKNLMNTAFKDREHNIITDSNAIVIE